MANLETMALTKNIYSHLGYISPVEYKMASNVLKSKGMYLYKLIQATVNNCSPSLCGRV